MQQPTTPTPIVQASAVSATGGTIHHLGHSPTRAAPRLPVAVNPSQQQLHTVSSSIVMSAQQQQQLQGLVSQLTQSPGILQPPQAQAVLQAPTTVLSTTPTKANPTSHSPLQSPERPRKRIKLEEKHPANTEIAKHRKLICDQKLVEMARVKENYNERLTELFYLQSGWNFMDYFQWKKRPSAQLIQLLKSGSLDSDDEDAATEKSINNEVCINV